MYHLNMFSEHSSLILHIYVSVAVTITTDTYKTFFYESVLNFPPTRGSEEVLLQKYIPI